MPSSASNPVPNTIMGTGSGRARKSRVLNESKVRLRVIFMIDIALGPLARQLLPHFWRSLSFRRDQRAAQERILRFHHRYMYAEQHDWTQRCGNPIWSIKESSAPNSERVALHTIDRRNTSDGGTDIQQCILELAVGETLSRIVIVHER